MRRLFLLRLPTFHLLHLAIHWCDALKFKRFNIAATARAFSCWSQLWTYLPSERTSSRYSNMATSRSLLTIQPPIMKYHHQSHYYKICINSYLYGSSFSFAFHDILLPADHILYSTPSLYLYQTCLLSMIHCLHSFHCFNFKFNYIGFKLLSCTSLPYYSCSHCWHLDTLIQCAS